MEGRIRRNRSPSRTLSGADPDLPEHRSPMIRTALPVAALLFAAAAHAQEDAPPPEREGSRTKVIVRDAGAMAPGYTLYAPLNDGGTYLIDADGNAVHAWTSDTPPGNSVYLLPNGNLLRAERPDCESPMHGGGEGGRLVELDWDGELVWTYELCDDERKLHHDVEPLPNGNVLVIVWTALSREEAIALGRPAEAVGDEGLWPDAVLELKPVRPAGAEVVWEWHAADHLVQDRDPEAPNHGVVADHPRRINVNIGTAAASRPETAEERRERLELEERLRALGYAGGDDDAADDDGPRPRGDWMHTNSIDYDAELDLIALSLRNFDEVWVIDHSTTTAEARGSTGGKQGVGGDLVWRYGNPANYHAGEASDRVCFGQHDAQWTRAGGAPALTIFNNGAGRPGAEDYSSVDWIRVPTDEDGVVTALVDGRFTQDAPLRSWTATPRTDVYSSHISGADPLPHGGALVCDGDSGRLLEVDAAGAVLWDFTNPIEGTLGRHGRAGRGPDGPPGGLFGPGARPPGERPGDGPPEGRRAGGPRSPNALFRATRIAPDHPGLEGRELTARPLVGDTQRQRR